MKRNLLFLTGITLITVGTSLPAQAQTYIVPVAAVGLVRAIAAQNAANKDIATKTTTTNTYRGQTFLMKRTPDDILTGEATDRITQLETQLALCHTALLTDSTSVTCPPERQATIRTNIKYLDLARPNWDQKAYRQEFKFYLAEDARRRRASK